MIKFKHHAALITAIVISIATGLPASANMATIQGTSGSRVNVRQSPSTSSLVRHYGFGGDRVTILNQTNAPDGYRWYFVEFPNPRARGWIRSDLLQVSATFNAKPAPPPPPRWVRSDLLQVSATATSQRISFSPGTSAAKVGGKVQGTQFRDYILNAGAGQTLTTSTIGTSPYLQVQVFDPNGSNLYTGSRD